MTAAAAVVALSACGNGTSHTSAVSPSASQTLAAQAMLDKAVSYLAAAPAFTLSGTGSSDGLRLGLHYTFVGSDSTGTVMRGPTTYDVRSVGGVRYLRPSRSLWLFLAPGKVGEYSARYGTRWLRIQPDNAPFMNLVALADRQSFIKTLLNPKGTLLPGTAKATVDGVVCDALRDSDVKNPSTLYLAVDDHRPIAVVNDGVNGGRSDLRYGSATAIAAPAASDVMDAPRLG